MVVRDLVAASYSHGDLAIHRFEDGLEETKLESGADKLDWMRRSVVDLRLWVCSYLVLVWS